jgi:hypothetical protein
MPDKKGWGFPGLSKKAHYFDNDAICLCRKWMFTGELDDKFHDHPDNCKECVRRRLKKYPEAD